MALALTVDLELKVVTCGGCGITYAIPAALHRQYKENGATVNCPNTACPWGGMVCGETKVQALKKELAAAKEAREMAIRGRRWAERARAPESRSHAATRGHLTRSKKRHAAAVCPCCKRSFKQLRRHMATKHPDYIESLKD